MAEPPTPLTNADFRKLLETPRAGRGGATPSFRAETPRQHSNSEGAKKQQQRKPFKPKPKPGATQEEDDEGPKYRDRAEERRRGINPDYETANQLASVLGSGSGVDVSKLSMEESKFLGGDIEHTHLVKGLDYALLQKERTRIATGKGEGEEGAADGAKAAPAVKREDLHITHAVARGVFDVLFSDKSRAAVREMFQPRRMAFVFNFDPEATESGLVLDTDVPNTLRRSKADCPPVQEAVFANIDSGVFERIVKIMSYIKTTAGGKRLKKKERDELLGQGQQQAQHGQHHQQAQAAQQGSAHPSAAAARKAAPAPAAAADEDDDIFGDAGTDYKPSASNKPKKQPQAQAQQQHEVDMDVEDGEVDYGPAPPPPPPAGGQPAYGYDYGYPDAAAYYEAAAAGQVQGYGDAAADGGYGGAYGTAADQQQQAQAQAGGDAKWRTRTTRGEEREVDYTEDAYMECYPMQAGLAAEVADSDEEDMGAMDMGRQGKVMSRHDFNTDEEWQEYKLKQENMPSAAFQFGVKAADGRKSLKALVGNAKELGKVKDQKLNSQLHKIEKIMKDKGHEHAGAFGRTPSRGGGGATATGEDPNLAVGARKRQRI